MDRCVARGMFNGIWFNYNFGDAGLPAAMCRRAHLTAWIWAWLFRCFRLKKETYRTDNVRIRMLMNEIENVKLHLVAGRGSRVVLDPVAVGRAWWEASLQCRGFCLAWAVRKSHGVLRE
jgi:hypothetical protein